MKTGGARETDIISEMMAYKCGATPIMSSVHTAGVISNLEDQANLIDSALCFSWILLFYLEAKEDNSVKHFSPDFCCVRQSTF
jgi:hypothetical protein